jgi:hypothetical protein
MFATMTSDGSPHARFRRALLTKNLTLIDAAARELRHVALDDALRMLIVMADRGDARFDRAGARFAARAISETRLGLAEARYVLALVEALPHSPDAIGELLRRTLTVRPAARRARPRRPPTAPSG